MRANGVAGGLRGRVSSSRSGSVFVDGEEGELGESGNVGVEREEEKPQILSERLMFRRSSTGCEVVEG